MLEGVADRARVEQATFGLLSLVGQPRSDDVRRSRAERLAAEAGRLLQAGGEQPPTVTIRPGEVRYATVGASA